MDFEPVEYGDVLVPASRLHLPEFKPGTCSDRFRGRQTIYTWMFEDRAEGSAAARRSIQLEVTGDLIAHCRDPGNVDIALHAARETSGEPVDRGRSIPPDGEPHSVVLRPAHAGSHRVDRTDGHDMTRVVWPNELRQTFRWTLEEPFQPSGRRCLDFYVPRGARALADGNDRPSAGRQRHSRVFL